MRRHRLIAGIASVVMLACAAGASASSGGTVGSCGSLSASVPYSHHGQHDRWRVYVRGVRSCPTALHVLNVVMHLGGTVHQGTSSASSYTEYRGWRCPFGQMGNQYCFSPTHRPYKRVAIARDCSVSCPTQIPSSDFPS